METVQSNKEVLSKPEAGPGRETPPLVLVDNLKKKEISLNLVRRFSGDAFKRGIRILTLTFVVF